MNIKNFLSQQSFGYFLTPSFRHKSEGLKIDDSNSEEKERERKNELISNTTETKIKETEERLKCLNNLSMPGGSAVQEALFLNHKLQRLKQTDEYSIWFKENKAVLEQLFKYIFEQFVSEEAKVISLAYFKDNNEVLFRGTALNKSFLSRLLTNYEYCCFAEGSSFKISLIKEE